jgi:hypothetical protein
VTPSPETAGVSDVGPASEVVGNGRYVVVGSLGAGSQGETLEAVDKREGRAVAVKRFTIRGAKSWKDVELAEREASVLASLSHSGLPRYIDHFEENGALYLVMEKIEGETLQTRRKRGAGLDQAQVTRFLRDAGACLRYLHSQAPPVVHRDIKPGNVILRPDGSYCLVDFGSVRDRLKPEGGSTVVGTFGFMAPEQFQGRAGPASDVYAVGATALSLLTGREPEDLPHKGLGVDVESALRGQVDRRLIVALLRMLEPDPDKRAKSVEDALRGAGLGEGSSAAAPPPKRSGAAAEVKAARRERLRERYSEIEDELRGREAERAERRARKFAAMVERRTLKQVERETRRAERRAHRSRRYASGKWHRAGPPVLPGRALSLLILLALNIASVATFALFQVLLPTLFTFVPVAGRRQRMLEIGRAGEQGLRRAREYIRYHFAGGAMPAELESFMTEAATRDAESAEGRRTNSSRAARQRISIDAEAEEAELQADAAAEADAAARRARQR